MQVRRPKSPLVILIAIAGLGWVSSARGQQEQSHQPPADTVAAQVQVPFRWTEAGNLCVAAKLNGRESLQLMFHTAVSEVSLTRDATRRMESLEFADEVKSNSWGGESTSRRSPRNDLQIGETKYSDVTIFEDLHSGPDTDGKFGWTLFEKPVMEIDGEGGAIRFYDRLPDLPDTFEPVATEVQGTAILINTEVKIGGEWLSHHFLFHTGFTGTLLLDAQFVKTKIRDRLKVTAGRELKDSHGNVITTRQATLPGLRIGDTPLTNVDGEYFGGKIGGRHMSVMGCTLIRKFHWYFDVENQLGYCRRIDG